MDIFEYLIPELLYAFPEMMLDYGTIWKSTNKEDSTLYHPQALSVAKDNTFNITFDNMVYNIKPPYNTILTALPYRLYDFRFTTGMLLNLINRLIQYNISLNFINAPDYKLYATTNKLNTIIMIDIYGETYKLITWNILLTLRHQSKKSLTALKNLIESADSDKLKRR